MTASGPKPPAHLAAATKRWWRSVVAEYQLEEHHIRLLTLACEAWDRAQAARALVAAEGLVVLDRFGQPKAHPAVAIERDARIGFARLVREIDLDGEPAPDPRPTRRR